jgi:hypothetical protein
LGNPKKTDLTQGDIHKEEFQKESRFYAHIQNNAGKYSWNEHKE